MQVEGGKAGQGTGAVRESSDEKKLRRGSRGSRRPARGPGPSRAKSKFGLYSLHLSWEQNEVSER